MPLMRDDDEIDPVVIGAGRDEAVALGDFLRGSLDEVSYYEAALGAGDVAALHAAGSAGKCR
jgi:hypothetical protein